MACGINIYRWTMWKGREGIAHILTIRGALPAFELEFPCKCATEHAQRVCHIAQRHTGLCTCSSLPHKASGSAFAFPEDGELIPVAGMEVPLAVW